MTPARYLLHPPHVRSSVGETDFRRSRGSLVDNTGCILLFVTDGCAVASINFRRYALRRGSMVLFFPDSVFRLEKTSADFRTRYVSLSYDLAAEGILDVPSPHFWDIVYNYPVYRATPEEWNLLNSWWEQMRWTDRETEGGYRDALQRTHFHTLLLAMDSRVAGLTLPPLQGDVNRQWRLVTDFFKLLTKHCCESRDVQFYADKLCITPSYLNKLCRKVLGASPKKLIDQETISEITSYLTNTDLSVKRIAEEMHFEDDSYLCRYFRRKTGMSPIDYRNNISGNEK